jgi:hypothetical protein
LAAEILSLRWQASPGPVRDSRRVHVQRIPHSLGRGGVYADEGIRVVIIDKDRILTRRRSSLAAVTAANVQHHFFAPLGAELDSP